MFEGDVGLNVDGTLFDLPGIKYWRKLINE